LDANIVATRMAPAVGGDSRQLPCPAFQDPFQYDDVVRLQQVREMLSEIRECDIVITGMGPIVNDTADGSVDITLSNDPKMNRQLADEARRAGAIGEICYWLFNERGQKVKGSHYAVGLGLDNLYRIARSKNRKVVLVVGGDQRRFKPLKVALNWGLANVLVSDTYTARYLVGEIS
jgi:DNA-binding transcriptional regulator LsrR (DeoR family)